LQKKILDQNDSRVKSGATILHQPTPKIIVALPNFFVKNLESTIFAV
jgi:hypothetical protein